ncbi:MAG: chorismate synthase [Rikenellaceae bacterium]|nr:chorismate synthase [Rikenellaceae bacterium]
MNSFGRKFRVSIFGESHGIMVGAVIDGCPPGIALSEVDMLPDLARRKSGAKGTTPRKEADEPRIISGVFNGYTTGAPITVVFENSNTRSGDYKNLTVQPRPGHADWVALKKYNGFNDYRGGGHFSGRITLGLVAAGTVAKKIAGNAVFKSDIVELGGTRNKEEFDSVIESALNQHDSVGGIVECTITGCPAGAGEPFFDSVESVISHAVFSVPAVKGVEFGAGFESARLKGSENNDNIIGTDGATETNNAGGINGGITNGNPIVFRVAVKPTPSISLPQDTVNMESGRREGLIIKGKHDACIALRIPVIIEAVAAIAIADLTLLSK